MLIIPIFRGIRQEDNNFKTCLAYISRLYSWESGERERREGERKGAEWKAENGGGRQRIT